MSADFPFLAAFDARETPVATTCPFCGTEILFGSLATRLEVEVRVCTACPPSDAGKAALLLGVLTGLETARATDDSLGIWSNPYPFASPQYHVWKRGWWAGMFAADDDERRVRARLAMDVSTGALCPARVAG